LLAEGSPLVLNAFISIAVDNGESTKEESSELLGFAFLVLVGLIQRYLNLYGQT